MVIEAKSFPRLTLYRGWDSPGVYVWSPFVTKLDARFRIAGLAYQSESGSALKAPKGKVPYVAIAGGGDEQSSLYPDSTLIIDKLVEEGLLEDLNAKLSPIARAHDSGPRALLEDKLYFFQVCFSVEIFSYMGTAHRCSIYIRTHQLTLDTPALRATRSGTLIIIPCDLISSQPYPTLFR